MTDDYFQYKGETLGQLLPCGLYYLKITTSAGYVYYSDWFLVESVYENLITAFTNAGYETLTLSGTSILSAINSADLGIFTSNIFTVTKGESIKVRFFLTLNSGTAPTIYISNFEGFTFGDSGVSVIGANEIELIPTWSGLAYIVFLNAGNVNFSTSEILTTRGYSEKYLTINFSNTCDLGDILYSDGFTQTVWFESETMENSYPQEEEGQKNGESRFVRTFARQVKKYLARTKDLPAYMVDVFNRMKLHNTVTLIDLVGDTNTVYNLEVEHEWLFDDKYYAKLDLTFDYDESVVVSSCCVNKT